MGRRGFSCGAFVPNDRVFMLRLTLPRNRCTLLIGCKVKKGKNKGLHGCFAFNWNPHEAFGMKRGGGHGLRHIIKTGAW